MIADRIWPTLQIGALTIVISVLIAVPMGVVAAWRHRSAIDYAVMTFSVLGFSVPVFVIGYVFIQIFSIELRWLPVQGYVPPSAGIAAFLARAVAPCLPLPPIYASFIPLLTTSETRRV